MVKPESSYLAKNVGSATSIEFNEMIYKLRRDQKDPIVLSYGEAPFDPIDLDFSYEQQKSGAHYSESRGVLEFRREVVADIFARFGVQLSADENIMVTAGSKIGSYIVFLSFVNSGDLVVLHEPAWVSYREHARLVGAEVSFVRYTESLLEGVKRISLQKKPKALVINNPNNPRGKLYSKTELIEVADYCHERNILLMVDESYSEYVSQGEFFSCTSLVLKYENLLVLQSVSKDLGLSGWRVGFLVGSKASIDVIVPFNQHLVTCAPTILQLVLAKNFRKIKEHANSHIKILMDKRAIVLQILENLNLRPLDGFATFYFFLDIGAYVSDAKKFCIDLLRDDLVSVIPGQAYGNSVSTFVRISIAAESLDRIEKGLILMNRKMRSYEE